MFSASETHEYFFVSSANILVEHPFSDRCRCRRQLQIMHRFVVRGCFGGTQNGRCLCRAFSLLLLLRQRPIYTQKSPTCTQKSPLYPQKSPICIQKSSLYPFPDLCRSSSSSSVTSADYIACPPVNPLPSSLHVFVLGHTVFSEFPPIELEPCAAQQVCF